jgi:hypothetical protein
MRAQVGADRRLRGPDARILGQKILAEKLAAQASLKDCFAINCGNVTKKC